MLVYCLRNLRAGMGWNVSNCHLITDKLTLVANEGSKQKAIVSFYRDDSDTVSFGLSYDHRQMMYESIVELTSFG